MKELTKEEIIAIAVAAIAEEMGTVCKALRVISFRELGETNLKKYLRENHISYKKYELEDELL